MRAEMFAEHMRAAIDAARTLTRLDDLSRSIWQAHGAGAVGDDDAQALAEHLHARKVVVRGEIKPVGIPPGRASIFPIRRPQRSPQRSVAIARRRHLAASGPMPPALASRFTTGQLAVLKIVADEIAASGRCTLTTGEIAARAGVCHRLAQGAVRLASGDGLLVVQERRRQGQVNLPNVIFVVSREWLAWIAKGSRGVGCKTLHPTDRRSTQEASRPTSNQAKGFRGSGLGMGARQNGRQGGSRDR